MKNYGRKVAFGAFVMLCALVALWLCLRYPTAGAVLFPSFATLAGAVTAAVVVGNVGEHFAKKGQP